MKGGQKTQTTTQTGGMTGPGLGMQSDVYNAARNAANNYTTVGPNDASNQALSGFQGAAAAGQNGLNALSGNAQAMQGFMNPYQSQVIDQMNQQYGRNASLLNSQINSQATAAGAFGGSRHGVAAGVAQGQLGNQHMADIANLLQSGYGNAQNVAGQVANMGFGANQALGSMGEYLRGIQQDQANPGVAQLGLLTQGMAGGGNTGYTQTTSTPLVQNKGSGALGGAATGASIGSKFGPWGAGIGAGIGGLLGMF